MIEDVTTSGKSMEETVPKVRGAADVEIVGLMVSLNRMEVGLGGTKSALDEIKDKYGFEGKAIVTMEEVVEHLYNRECEGKVIINDELKIKLTEFFKKSYFKLPKEFCYTIHHLSHIIHNFKKASCLKRLAFYFANVLRFS